MTLKLLDRLMNRHRPEPKSEPEPEDPTQLRYVYRVVVDAERDDKLLVRDEPVTIDAEVPFRGRAVIVDGSRRSMRKTPRAETSANASSRSPRYRSRAP